MNLEILARLVSEVSHMEVIGCLIGSHPSVHLRLSVPLPPFYEESIRLLMGATYMRIKLPFI